MYMYYAGAAANPSRPTQLIFGELQISWILRYDEYYTQERIAFWL
jgi:hypothetical protein